MPTHEEVRADMQRQAEKHAKANDALRKGNTDRRGSGSDSSGKAPPRV